MKPVPSVPLFTFLREHGACRDRARHYSRFGTDYLSAWWNLLEERDLRQLDWLVAAIPELAGVSKRIREISDPVLKRIYFNSLERRNAEEGARRVLRTEFPWRRVAPYFVVAQARIVRRLKDRVRRSERRRAAA